MTFALANAAVAELWSSLRSFIGESAVSEITVRPPAREGDEASFLRLVAWSYVMVFEAGRVVVPYLMEMRVYRGEPCSDPKKACRNIHALRTWSSHNLGFGSERDVEISQRVRLWFKDACGKYPPGDTGSWERCFQALCSEIEIIATYCQRVVTSELSDPDDGEAARADLRRRIERAWPAQEYHILVEDVAVRLGIPIDTKKFSNSRLAKWRQFLETLPGQDDPKGHMIRLIERDLLDLAADVLPIDGRDVMKALKLKPGPAVGDALLRARELYRSGIRESEVLLDHLNRSLVPDTVAPNPCEDS